MYNFKNKFSVQQNNTFIETNTPFFIENPILYQRHILSLPPEESYFFFPKGEEIIIQNNKKPEKALRRIFFNTKYTNYENEKIKQYKKIIKSHPENLKYFPDYWNDAYNLMFIYSTDCDLPKAYERMIKYFHWYQNFFPLTFKPKDKAIEILNSGFAYCYGRDHEFRPNLIVQPYIYQNHMKDYSENDLIRATVFLCEYCKNNLLINGQIENWNMIVNVKGINIISIPDSMKKVMKCLSDNFLAKLYKCYILNLSFFLKILYKIICNFLEEVTVRKFVIINGKSDKTMWNFIRSDNIEKRFGGEAEDLIYDDNNLFPPNMPLNRKFLLDNEKRNEILISKDEYIKRLKNLPKKSISPFILEEIENKKKEEEKKQFEEKLQKQAEERLKEEEENEKEILNMINGIDWEIKEEFKKNDSFSQINSNFSIIPTNYFEKDLKNFNINKNKCNWDIGMKINY
jgi:hypothetical protein